MQQPSIFLRRRRTTLAWASNPTPPLERGSGPACRGLPHTSHKTGHFPVLAGIYGLSGEECREGVSRLGSRGRGQEQGGDMTANSGGGGGQAQAPSKGVSGFFIP